MRARVSGVPSKSMIDTHTNSVGQIKRALGTRLPKSALLLSILWLKALIKGKQPPQNPQVSAVLVLLMLGSWSLVI